MKVRLFLITLTGMILSCSFIFARTRNLSGTDGCGLGWKFTTRKSFLATSTRGTTHMTLPAPFSMTSGTSGCDVHSLAAQDMPAVHYVATHFDGLKHEIAAGNGELLRGLSEMMGCSDIQAFSHTLRANYQDVLSDDKTLVIEMFKNIKKATGKICRA